MSRPRRWRNPPISASPRAWAAARPTQVLATALDTNDHVYVTGYTEATNLATPGAYQTAFTGTQEAFVAAFNTNGALLFCTYLGGSAAQSGQGIVLNAAGNIFVTGYTSSTNFPTLNPLQATNAGGYDAFLTELAPGGGALVYSTYFGGKGFDAATAIGLDTNGSPLISGYTQSTNLPIFHAAQPTNAGNGDAFLARFAPDGGSLVYATYLGGGDSEDNATKSLIASTATALANLGGAVAVDPQGAAYVTGWTYSTNFPATNAFQPTSQTLAPGLYPAAFVTKVDPAGKLVYSTYFGGMLGDYSRAIGIDGAGQCLLRGKFLPWRPARDQRLSTGRARVLLVFRVGRRICRGPGCHRHEPPLLHLPGRQRRRGSQRHRRARGRGRRGDRPDRFAQFPASQRRPKQWLAGLLFLGERGARVGAAPARG